MVKHLSIARIFIGAIAALSGILFMLFGRETAFTLKARATFTEVSLETQLAGKNVVFVGETDYYTKETIQFRESMFTKLYDHGFDNFLIEYGRSYMEYIDLYMQTGDESFLSPPSDGAFKTPPIIKDFECPKAQAACAISQRVRQMFINLRQHAIASGRPVPRIIGFDYDHIHPHLTYIALDKEIRKLSDRKLTSRIAKIVEKTRENSISELYFASVKIEETLDAASASSSKTEWQDAIALARHLRQSLWFRVAQDSFIAKHERDDRESFMFNYIAKAVNGDRKGRFVVSAHVLHGSKNSTNILLAAEPKERRMWKSIGTMMNEQIPERTLYVWMVSGPGMALSKKLGKIALTPNVTNVALSSNLESGTMYQAFTTEKAENFIVGSANPITARLSEQTDLIVYYGQHSMD